MEGPTATPTETITRVQRSRLIPPTSTDQLCERLDLLRELDEGSGARAVFIVGPAGYGKTTFIAQLCKRLIGRGVSFGYYLASERDREPIAFLGMVAAALEQAGIDFSGSPLRTDHSIPAEAALEDVLLRLELAGQPATLIIDDFDRVDDPAVTELVQRLLAQAPAAFRIVIASRSRPRISLSALALRGDLFVIDAARLRLSRSEVALMLDLPETSTEVVKVADLTQGWPVTVQLYRLYLARRPSGDRDLGIGGRVREVNDYLTEQLFASLPVAQLDLLVDISDRDEVEPMLVDCMRARADSAGLLEQAARNLSSLMRAMDGDGAPIYRLHPLLATHLRDRLARDPAHRTALSANASTWYLAQNRYPEAVRTAIESRDHDVSDAVLRALRPLHILLADGVPALRAILHELPGEVVEAHPRLRIMAAIAHFKAGFFVEAQRMLEGVRLDTADFTVDPDGRPGMLEAEGHLTALIFIGQLSRFPSELDQLYDRVIKAARDDPTLWGACENVRMLISQGRGDLTAATDSILKARRIYQAVGLTRYGNLQLIGHELLVVLAEGKLRRAADLIAQYQKRPSLEELDETGVPAMLKIVFAAIRYEREFDQSSVDMLGRGLAEHGANESWFDQYAITYPPVVTRLYLRDGADVALRFINDARLRARKSEIEALPRFVDFLEVELRARVGQISDATALAAILDLDRCVHDGDAAASWRERDAGACARIVLRLAQAEGEAALAAAAAFAESGRSGGRLRTQIKGMIFAALALDLNGARPRALDVLLDAVLLAHPEGFVAPFAEERALLVPLLDQLAGRHGVDVYAKRHLAAIQRAITRGMPGASAQDLTDRELEIVTQLMAGASNKVIARRMGVTDNTVKFHLKKIFAKLDVSTRRAAAAKMATMIQRTSDEMPPR